MSATIVTCEIISWESYDVGLGESGAIYLSSLSKALLLNFRDDLPSGR
jgi:hypothetical protein